MNIKRTLDTVKATYDITGLSKQQFGHLLACYEKQFYIYCDKYPEKGSDELLDKLREMKDSDTLII